MIRGMKDMSEMFDWLEHALACVDCGAQEGGQDSGQYVLVDQHLRQHRRLDHRGIHLQYSVQRCIKPFT